MRTTRYWGLVKSEGGCKLLLETLPRGDRGGSNCKAESGQVVRAQTRVQPLASTGRYQPYILAAYKTLFPRYSLDYHAPVADEIRWHTHVHW
jgi:hypothetical protein